MQILLIFGVCFVFVIVLPVVLAAVLHRITWGEWPWSSDSVGELAFDDVGFREGFFRAYIRSGDI